MTWACVSATGSSDQPSKLKRLGAVWGIWIILALIRTVTGHLLTRSVGWACPVLFNHHALYEVSTGFGAALVAYLVVFDPLVLLPLVKPPGTVARWSSTSRGWAAPWLVGLLCWLECRPWAYGTALVFAIPAAYLCRRFRMDATPTVDVPVPVIAKEDRINASSLGLPRPPGILASLAAVLVPWLIFYHLVPPTRLPLPVTPQPLLDILPLSYPRPVPLETSIDIINSTVLS